eukprot:CAMPEP_0119357268 /NCGR_PEP_ID=MMETSP1334-20130426/5689_1 /TAXON_ID=127549 /ORGANISM="Calcidiscus leptoporus, Strain RCC1130" /LENGTH=352 /DNA_ID=CAMNT_0007371471 /DNA_START=39 /DNA_END=1097 /DNA_ORIENTATION=-
MAKAEVAVQHHSAEELAQVLSFYDFTHPLKAHTRLYGGYSGSNYRVEDTDGRVFVLKLCHSYSDEDVEAVASLMAHVRAQGVHCACAALPRSDGDGHTLSTADGTPCCLLTWVEGKPADKVMATGVVAEKVLREIGRGLGMIHSVSAGKEGQFRTYMQGGACDVRKHISDEYAAALASSADVEGHDFLPFYEAQATQLRIAMSTAELPEGVLHGDPFLDNVLVDGVDGSLAGFVDFEDACVGPLLFDVACCACACCFRQSDNALDIRRLRALMEGYSTVRPLAEAERRHFVAFMKLSMLCNCAWRFKQFNIDHREISECRDAHRELQERVLSLEDDICISAVEGVLSRLPKE